METITQEELNSIKEIRQMYLEIIQKIGQSELQLIDMKLIITNLEGEKKNLETQYQEIKSREKVVMDSLIEKYGVADINVETGEINRENQ